MGGGKQIDFEAAIERDLLDAGYLTDEPSDFDANLALVRGTSSSSMRPKKVLVQQLHNEIRNAG